jgi:hypothetical protein
MKERYNMGINKKYKYWELWHDPDSLNGNPEGDQCIATHWSEQWYNIKTLLAKTDEEIKEIIRDDIDFAKKIRGERVTKRSIEPAFKEFKQIIVEHNFQ